MKPLAVHSMLMTAVRVLECMAMLYRVHPCLWSFDKRTGPIWEANVCIGTLLLTLSYRPMIGQTRPCSGSLLAALISAGLRPNGGVPLFSGRNRPKLGWFILLVHCLLADFALC